MGRLVIAFTLGIWAGQQLPLTVTTHGITSGILFLFMITAACCPAWVQYHLRPYQGFILLVLVASSGALAISIKEDRRRTAEDLCGEGIFRFQVDERTPSKQGGYRLIAHASKLTGHTLQPLPGKTILYLRTGERTPDVLPGASFFAPAEVQPIQGPFNPGEPDFRQIHGRNGIYTTTFLRTNQGVEVSSGGGRWLSRTLDHQRRFMLGLLRTYIRDSTAAGLAEAILLGYRNDLSPELGQAYARTGVMHVIAISGLHLGLIFSILLSLFRIIPGSHRKPWLPLLVAVPAIWWFSLLTGASASVIRSAVMSSLPVIGALVNRRTWTINVCSASMLLLLAWNPGWLWDVGFQLSYAAVWGILLYQRPLLQKLPLRHPAAQKTWELVAVTLAAQVFTTPLVIFYFHQFPLLFIFANLVAVPLSSIILLGTMLICLLHAFPGKAALAGTWTEWLIDLLNAFIRRIDMVPHTVLRHLHIETGALLLIFGLLVCLHFWARTGKRAWRLPVLANLAMLVSLLFYQAGITTSRRALCILQVKGHTAILQVEGHHAQQFLLPSPQQKADRVPAMLAAVRQHYRVRAYASTLLTPASVQVLRSGQRTIILVSGKYHDGLKGRLPRAHIILLRSNAGASSLAEWFNATGCTQFIADGSNSLWKIQQWEEEAKKLPLRLHSTPLAGAFLLD